MVNPIMRVINKIDEIKNIDNRANVKSLESTESRLREIIKSPRDRRIEQLQELTKEITQDRVGFGGSLLDPLNSGDEQDAILYGMIYEALAEEGDILAQMEYNDTSKYASWNSQMWTSNQQTSNRIVNEFEGKILGKHRDRLKKRLAEELNPVENIGSKYLESQGVIDSSFNAFKSLIISQGGNTPILRVVNPDTANITKDQKDFQ
jgi:hypothetical protein